MIKQKKNKRLREKQKDYIIIVFICFFIVVIEKAKDQIKES